jgi:hypothetical protein
MPTTSTTISVFFGCRDGTKNVKLAGKYLTPEENTIELLAVGLDAFHAALCKIMWDTDGLGLVLSAGPAVIDEDQQTVIVVLNHSDGPVAEVATTTLIGTLG